MLLSVVLTQTNPTAAFYLLPARMGELAVGAAIAIWAPVFFRDIEAAPNDGCVGRSGNDRRRCDRYR